LLTIILFNIGRLLRDQIDQNPSKHPTTPTTLTPSTAAAPTPAMDCVAAGGGGRRQSSTAIMATGLPDNSEDYLFAWLLDKVPNERRQRFMAKLRVQQVCTPCSFNCTMKCKIYRITK
jgi:hypothetical protein